jgi:cobyrinic acid a,c-diamide synthase
MLALTAALVRRGYVVQGCKIGPDFIDPAHHQALTARPAYNLDSWMNGARGVAANVIHALRHPPKPDVLLIEGVMGLFDGAHGNDGNASTAEAARLLKLPVLLLLDTRGLAQSAAAMALGYISHMPELVFAGLACTQVGGPGHKDMLREALHALPVPLLGLLPEKDAPRLASRHLGLVSPHEKPLDAARREHMAGWAERNLDVEALLARMTAIDAPCAETTYGKASDAPGKKILIARDAAFCFLYPELPDLLREAGARCVFFSPTEDAGLPEGDIVYVPGGYPESFAQRLSANASMREAMRAFSLAGKPVYGEGGGYVYLMEELQLDGKNWPMTACLPLRCRLESERAALGYRVVRPARASPLASKEDVEALVGRGHEFHYARITDGPRLPELWRLAGRNGQGMENEGALLENTAGSWVHLAPYGAWSFWRNLLQSSGAR